MFTFQVLPSDVDKLEAKVKDTFRQLQADQAMMTDIGRVMTDRIRYQARVTKPVNDTGSFPPLKDKTVRKRKYLAQYNAVDSTYALNRSNLTLTGAFLNSLGFVNSGLGQITLSFQGTHPGYKTKSGQTKNPPKMSDLYGYLVEKGFSALTFAGVDNNQPISKLVTNVVRSHLRRSLKS